MTASAASKAGHYAEATRTGSDTPVRVSGPHDTHAEAFEAGQAYVRENPEFDGYVSTAKEPTP